jgi:hypothetical protein
VGADEIELKIHMSDTRGLDQREPDFRSANRPAMPLTPKLSGKVMVKNRTGVSSVQLYGKVGRPTSALSFWSR